MSVIADLIRAGVDPDLIASVAEALVDAARRAPPAPSERSSAAIRQERYRAKKALQSVTSDVTSVTSDDVTSRDQKGASPVSPAPPMIYNSTPPTPSTPSTKNFKRDHVDSPVDLLACVLDRPTAQGVVDHRRALKKPLTPLAAKMLADKFAAVDDPNAAARMMIERGWQGFNPAWIREERGRGPPGVRRFSSDHTLNALAEIYHDAVDERSRQSEQDFQFDGATERP